MNILVSGASGFVGQHLMQLLRRRGHTVTGLGKLDVDKAANDCQELDLLDQAAIQAFDFTPFDGVIHLAGLAAVGPSFEHPLDYITANAGMQINLFQTILEQKAHPRALLISTGGVYAAKHLPITEETPIDAPNPYAVSKLTQEQLAHYYGKRGLEIIIARPFNHIGPGQNEGFISADLAKQVALAEHDGQGVVQVGDLSSKRDYTDVRDIARAYELLITKGKVGELYNVCSGRSYSGQEILDGLLAHSKCKIKVETDKTKLRPSDVPNIIGSHSKLTWDTHWEPVIPLDQTLADVLSDWRQRIG